jgi:hypothetical protein
MRSDRRLPGGPTRSACTPQQPRAEPGDLGELVYELLDAHDDTARLAAELADDVSWQAHLAYLRDLQRVGRSMLAQTPCAREDATAA